MKKNYLFSILIALLLHANVCQAQDYQITFTAAGASASFESIEVKNLTHGTSLTLAQGDILHLTGTATGIFDPKPQDGDIMVYPNPMTNHGNIEFTALAAGEYTIDLFSIAGKRVLTDKLDLTAGRHVLSIEGLSAGVYGLKIQAGNKLYSAKIISQGAASGSARITYARAKSIDTNVNSTLKGATATNLVDMQYNDGDRLLITATSGDYVTVKSIVPSATATENIDFTACVDGDGNNYKTVIIGTQTWMADNLKTTKYLNGDIIGTTASATTDISLESTPKYQWAYEGNANNVDVYGRLYTWYAITDSRGTCPAGWHVPTDEEWTTLENYVANDGFSGREGTVLKTVEGWLYSGLYCEAGTNEYGFDALPGGYRNTPGTFSNNGYRSFWWSTTEYDSPNFGTISAWLRSFDYGETTSVRDKDGKKNGIAVRCVKD
jgi:uncharacterized protein (TIGR02145 family)